MTGEKAPATTSTTNEHDLIGGTFLPSLDEPRSRSDGADNDDTISTATTAVTTPAAAARCHRRTERQRVGCRAIRIVVFTRSGYTGGVGWRKQRRPGGGTTIVTDTASEVGKALPTGAGELIPGSLQRRSSFGSATTVDEGDEETGVDDSRMIPTAIMWPHEGRKVYVTGTFSGWKRVQADALRLVMETGSWGWTPLRPFPVKSWLSYPALSFFRALLGASSDECTSWLQ